jgi:multidrug resistance efflux pump
MLIILCLYIVALWLVFSKYKLVRWGWLSGTISLLVGGFILATFLALFNYLTPSGRVTVTGRVVEVMPNVTGQIVTIPVKPNVPVKINDVLFQIDPAPFQYKVAQLQASLAAAKQNVEILKANYDQATANVTGLTAQVAFNTKRNEDIQKLAAEGANTAFQAQDRQNQYETVLAQLNVAKAAQQSAKLALDSEIGGVNTTVAQTQAQLDDAVWELSQTTVRAPADGYVTVVALTVGDRALQARSVLSFIVEKEITLVGLFSQNGFQTIKEGAAVDIVFDNVPGRIYHARIVAIPKGIGQGQLAGNAGAHHRARRGDGISGRDIDTRRDEPRPASAGDVRQRHRVCRQRGRNRPSGVDSGVGGFLYGISLAGRTQNGPDAQKSARL